MKRQPDLLSFSFGMLFIVAAVLFMLARALSLSIDLRWLSPVALVILGGGLVFGGIRQSRRDADLDDE